jgi:ubiquinone/menaquinone biosynthesis C-methylase UbiE
MGKFGRFAEYYDLVYQRMVDYEKECDLLEKVLAESSRKTVRTVLDVGCGSGSHALILSKRGYTVTGIDVSRKMIEKAKRKTENEGTEFFVQDMRNLDLNGEFDCAFCMFGVSDTSSQLKI